MTDPHKLSEQKQQHKRIKRLRALFDRKLTDMPQAPGFTFEGKNGEAIKAFKASW